MTLSSRSLNPRISSRTASTFSCDIAAQYPAGSGVGVSVLLGQPHGCEGLLWVGERVDRQDRVVANCPEMSVAGDHVHAAALGPRASREDDHHVIAALEELFGLPDDSVECRDVVLEESLCLLAPSMRPGVGSSLGRHVE